MSTTCFQSLSQFINTGTRIPAAENPKAKDMFPMRPLLSAATYSRAKIEIKTFFRPDCIFHNRNDLTQDEEALEMGIVDDPGEEPEHHDRLEVVNEGHHHLAEAREQLAGEERPEPAVHVGHEPEERRAEDGAQEVDGLRQRGLPVRVAYPVPLQKRDQSEGISRKSNSRTLLGCLRRTRFRMHVWLS